MSDFTASSFDQIPLEITVCVGKARTQIRDLLTLQSDALLALDRGVNDPVDLYIGERLIARGELQAIEGDPNGQLAVRLIEVIPPQGGL